MGKRAWAIVLAIGTVIGLAAPSPSPAVVILDSTWREEGGAPGRDAEGFGAHIRLAHEPQFRSLVSLSYDSGETWGDASATWIGNDGRYGYLLTAAHNFDDAPVDEVLFRTDGGMVLGAQRAWIHPGYNTKGDRTGVDVAVVRLDRPVTDAGTPPALYAGSAERGQTVTFVGFGMRGIGSVGENERFHRGSDKAAAQGVVEEAEALRPSAGRTEDPGNYLTVFLPREDGGVDNPYGGARRPVSRLAGLLGSGDSGGSAWMRRGGEWVIVGVNAAGDGEAQYGDNSWFVRVSGVRSWIASVYPGARFIGDAGALASPAPPAPALPVPSAKAPSVPPPPPVGATTAAGCAPRERLLVLSEGAWYPARARGPGKTAGSCVVRYDGYSEEHDEAVDRSETMPWSDQGPGVPVAGCEQGAAVVAEDEGVWYPGRVVREMKRGCLVRYDDPEYEDEAVPFARLRALR